MKNLWQDLRFGAQMLWKNPGFALVAAFTLALGIGANAAIFSVVNGVLLRPLPYRDPAQLMMISAYSKQDKEAPTTSASDFHDYRQRSQTFAGFAGMLPVLATLTGDGPPETVDEAIVTWSLFPLLGVEMAQGRNFTAEEDVVNGPKVVVISHGLWQRRYGAQADLVGRTILVNDERWQVIGVLPADFELHLPPDAHRWKDKSPDLWKLMQRDFAGEQRGNRYLTVLGRMKPGVATVQAQADMDRVAEQLRAEHPVHQEAGMRIRVAELQGKIVGNVRSALYVLLAAVGFVLLIACANVAGLLLVRALARGKELAIRAALGATRARLVRQALTESLLLALGGGLAGLLLAFWGLRLLHWLKPANLPRLESVAMDWRVLAFSFAACLLTALLAGLAPALRLSRPDLQTTLKEGGNSSAATDQRGLQSVFVTIQMALSLILLIGAALLMRSFIALQNVQPGFQPENVLTFQVTLPYPRYGIPRNAVFFQQLEERLARLPGVTAVGTTSQLPFTGKGYGTGYSWDEQSGRDALTADWRFITPNYLQTTSTRLLAGRWFTEQDDPQHPRVVIVDETLARKAWPDENAIGKRLLVGDSTPPLPVWMEVVGVIEHVRNHDLSAQGREQVYIPYAQKPVVPWMNVAVRASVPPLSLAKAIEQEVQTLDKNLPVNNVRLLESYVADALAPARFSLTLMSVFSGVALLLAAIGVYGVIAYSVSQRTQEIGVRLALGAQTADVLRLILKQGLRLTAVGVAIGLAAAGGLTRMLKSQLYDVSATDPLIFAGVAALLTTIALLACCVPARRATRVNPLVALKTASER
jgi:putative ABC transport system permease protein